MPRYGPGVLGEEAAAEEAAIEKQTAKMKYGPGVVGEIEFEKKKAEVEAAEEGGEVEVSDLTIADLEDALDASNVSAFLEVELSREDGPRVGALKALRSVEEEGQNRPDVLEMIDDQLDEG